MSDFRLFAVTGHPVLHSKSPQMHNAAFEALGINAAYVRLAAESAADAMESARVFGMAGLSVTAPFKEDFFSMVQERDGNAAETGAVNTVLFGKKGKTQGFNTDVDGVKGSFQAAGVEIAGSKAVVIGGGGAAMAAAYALANGGADVTVANRTIEKAEKIAIRFRCSACSLDADGLANALDGAQMLVSTASTAERIVPKSLLRKGLAVLDAYYAKETLLSKDAKAAGCRVLDTDSWLLHQGFAAFEILTGAKAPVDAMKKALQSPARAKKTNIGLVGMMGSGKTTTARAIGARTGMWVAETDAEIEKKAGKSIAEIFEEDGEASFREMENDAVAMALRNKNCVISFGGGAMLSEANRKAIAAGCTVVWLHASVPEMAARAGSGKNRPLLSGKDVEAEIGRLLAGRKPLYASACDLAVCAGGKNAGGIAGLICDEIGFAGKN